jgi:hypothetical protein
MLPAQETPYMKPPQAILDVLNAPEPGCRKYKHAAGRINGPE